MSFSWIVQVVRRRVPESQLQVRSSIKSPEFILRLYRLLVRVEAHNLRDGKAWDVSLGH